MGLDRIRLYEWILSRAVHADGAVLSWVNQAHPGYPYPEAAGLVLGWLARTRANDDLAARVAERLVRDMSSAGAVGRGTAEYLFDTAAALGGLVAARTRRLSAVDDEAVRRLFDFVVDSLERSRAVVNGPVDSQRWSTTWSPHLLKVALAVRAYGALTDDPRCRVALSRLERDFAVRAATVPTRDAPAYAHAFLYGLEGLAAIASNGQRRAARDLRTALDALTGMQHPRGGIPSMIPAPNADAVIATDATAQAVRLWALVDQTAFAIPIERALGHIARMQTASGGLRYGTASEDENTWCAVFALQAVEFADRGAEVGAII